MFFHCSPNPQVILSCLHECRDVAAISTEFPHQWRFLSLAISQLNIIWWGSLAIYIHGHEGDVDICSIGLRYDVDTSRKIWVGVWIRW